MYQEIINNKFTNNDIIISTNPLMDLIYLGQANYAIPWSLTGREGDTTIREKKDIYSGAKRLHGEDGWAELAKIGKLQKKGNVYIIIDSLAYRRMSPKLKKDIIKSGTKIFETKDKYSVGVYLFPMTHEEGVNNGGITIKSD